MLSSFASPSGLGACWSPVKQSQHCSNTCHSSGCSSPAQLLPCMNANCRASSSHSSPVACLSSTLAGASINADPQASPVFSTTAARAYTSPLSTGSAYCRSIRSPVRPLFRRGLGANHNSTPGFATICNSTPAGGATPGLSSGNEHSHKPRSTSPMPTAEPYVPVPECTKTPQHSTPSDSNGVMSMSSSAAAAATAEPAAGTTGLPSAGMAAAAQAEAEAAVTATTSVADLSEQHSAAVLAGMSVQTELQDLFTLLRFQAAAKLPITQQASTLTAIVKHAAADNIPVAILTTSDRLQLLDQLLCSDPAIAVLAAEVICRACSQDLKPWAHQLTLLVPKLLQIIQTHSSSSSSSDDAESSSGGKHMPLLFFAVSALVRMSSDCRIANAIAAAGGVPILVNALELTPPAVCQVTTFSLFRLMREVDGDLTEDRLSNWHDSSAGGDSYSLRSGEADEQPELLLIQYARQGAFSKLCAVVTAVPDGSAHELAFSMLLSMALIPQVQRLVADRNEVQKVVQVLKTTERDSTRLEVMLVLGRLAARCVAVQQDAVREGAVPVLVNMMQDGTDEERCHASRLLALLGQHPSTHQVILQAGALPVVLQLLQNRGHRSLPGAPYVHSVQSPGYGPNGQPLHIWHAAHASYNKALAAGLSSQAASTEAAVAAAAAATPVRTTMQETGGMSGQHEHDNSSSSTSSNMGSSEGVVNLGQQHQQHAFSAAPVSSGGSSSSSGKLAKPAAALPLVGPNLVLEQAVGVVCMLTHNPDNHFAMVGEGIVPMLISLLNQETSGKTLTYLLASLLMLAMAEPRHAAVVARAGAVPLLVSVVREGGQRPTNRELGAALLAVLCRSQDVQGDVVSAGGIPALTRLLGSGTDGARCYASECLVQLASASDIRCRLVVRAGALEQLLPMLEPNSSSVCLLWAARLIKVLMQETAGVKELFTIPRIIAMLPELLARRPVQHQQLHSTHGASSSGGSSGRVNLTASPAAAAAAAPSRNYGMNLSSLDVELQDEDDEGAGDGDLEKAQAHLAWVVAALAAHAMTRSIVAEIGSFLVRPLVTNLRDSQATHGPGYSLSDVLDGMANCRQASSAAALRAMSRADDRLAALINAELALQLWMGCRVELPRIEEDWPSALGWYTPGDG